jgi:hypothetical protein
VKKDVLPYALWITPNFTKEMESGIAPPPFVNQDKVDWDGLLFSLEEKFNPEGHNVKMRLCNDTIDQVTIHFREAGLSPGTIECLDFGASLQAVAKKSKNRVIPIRSEWAHLHHLKDRIHVPPPIALPLILSGNVEDIVIFTFQIRQILNIKATRDVLGMLMQKPVSEDDMQGYLPADLMKLFESHFGVAYKPFSVLTPLVKIGTLDL